MSRTLLMIVVSLIAVAGCKKEESSTAAVKPVEDRVKWGDQVPDTEASKVFAEKLVMAEIKNLRVTDDGAVLTYRNMKFDANGSWLANGDVKIDDEKMECTESGTWTMEEAESPTTSRLDYTIDKTNCAGRTAGDTQRASMDLGGAEPDIRFR